MKEQAISGSLGLALGVAAALAVLSGGEKATLDVKGEAVEFDVLREDRRTVPVAQLDRDAKQLAKMGVDVDGGVVAFLDVTTDAGTERVALDAYPCVRRPVGSKPDDCMRQVPGDVPRDFGEDNTFAAELAVGAGCEPVPFCSVWLGQKEPQP